MKRLRAWRARLADLGRVVRHRLNALMRGRPSIHVIVSGTDLPSLHYIVDEIRRVAPAVGLDEDPTDARAFASDFREIVTSWHPDDLTRCEDIVADVGRYRRIVLVATTADPRDSVCATDPRLPHQYADGFDYRFRFGRHGKKSFTAPGVLARMAGLESWRGQSDVTVVTVTRDSCVDNSASVFRNIADATGSARCPEARALRSVANSAIAMAEIPTWPGRKETRERVARQVALEPLLDSRAVEMGYPATEDILDAGESNPEIKRGTVIAFHTPDDIYRAEAARLKSTLDKLGLDHHFFEVEPEKNWVRTTLLKPSWIIKARDELGGPLLYIDVDAFVHQDPWPYLSQYDADLAAVVYDNGELNSASIWINDTSGARDLLRRWRDLADTRRGKDQGDLEPTGDNGDQGVLRQAVVAAEESGDQSVSFQRFPVNLTYIFDRGEMTYTVGPVIIEQLQASRESTQHEKRLARRRQRLEELEKSHGR